MESRPGARKGKGPLTARSLSHFARFGRASCFVEDSDLLRVGIYESAPHVNQSQRKGGRYTCNASMGTGPSPFGMISMVCGPLVRPCASVVV